jgi:DNA-directed RNA polymerase specialized sigma24 family protein
VDGAMTEPDEFDQFYKDVRTRLLLLTYCLTGDLPSSRAAVRDAFVVAWHHWRKVSRVEDPESWVR